jgi:lipooligosaccharide transport system ATP-binding protein
MEEAYQIADSIIIMEKGKRVLEGSPRKLLSEGIEPWVLEVLDREAFEASAGMDAPAGLRRESGPERMHFFSGAPEALHEFASRLPAGSSHVRPTTLEDLFLRATGRQLNDEQ